MLPKHVVDWGSATSVQNKEYKKYFKYLSTYELTQQLAKYTKRY